MKIFKAKKVVIITEKLLYESVCEVIDSCKASGYTISSVGGRGSRDVRSQSEQASVIEGFSNVKIEVIVEDLEHAKKITEIVTKKFLEDYSGITFIEDVEVLRPTKFLERKD